MGKRRKQHAFLLETPPHPKITKIMRMADRLTGLLLCQRMEGRREEKTETSDRNHQGGKLEERREALTRDGESARPPTEAFSSSMEGGTHLALSASSGLILILNFFLLSSSSSESLEEKNSFPLEAGERASRICFFGSMAPASLQTERISWAWSAGCRLKPSSSTSGEAWQRERWGR